MKGTYILVISLINNLYIKIGTLGTIQFKEGYYLYIGSAMGTKGPSTLINRVKRHILPQQNKKIHWHIDYLLDNKDVSFVKIYLIPSVLRLECIIAQELILVSDDIIKNFGSSDCGCNSHLLYFKSFSGLEALKIINP